MDILLESICFSSVYLNNSNSNNNNNTMRKTTSKKQDEALKKPCPLCNGKLGIIGDLADFDHIENDNPCRYCLDFQGKVIN